MSAPNFADVLSKPADSIKRPPTLPAGTYHGIISRYEFGESSVKKTKYCRYHVTLQSAGDDIDPQELIVDGKPVDLSKKQLRSDFYLTEDAAYRLVEFLQSCGAETSGRPLGEVIPDAVNARVIAAVTVQMGQNNEPFNNIQSLRGDQ